MPQHSRSFHGAAPSVIRKLIGVYRLHERHVAGYSDLAAAFVFENVARRRLFDPGVLKERVVLVHLLLGRSAMEHCAPAASHLVAGGGAAVWGLRVPDGDVAALHVGEAICALSRGA